MNIQDLLKQQLPSDQPYRDIFSFLRKYNGQPIDDNLLNALKGEFGSQMNLNVSGNGIYLYWNAGNKLPAQGSLRLTQNPPDIINIDEMFKINPYYDNLFKTNDQITETLNQPEKLQQLQTLIDDIAKNQEEHQRQMNELKTALPLVYLPGYSREPKNRWENL